MNKELLERLLYEDESTTLDFKKEQYPFVKASPEDKAELLKDILGFTNAWRRSDAYILIGVREVRGGRSEVLGIPASDHLPEHSLQQFVSNLTNQPVRFHYETFDSDGKQIGIIRIEQQTRPVYLKKDYGKLQREKVYVRRGSSTDPQKPASPEEIAQMRVGSGPASAELAVTFAHVERDEALGRSASWSAEYCEMPSRDVIPDQARRPRMGPLGINLPEFGYEGLNEDYFRELADFEFARRLFRPLRLLVTNVGEAAAGNVRVEITVPVNSGMIVMESQEMPQRPRRRGYFMGDSLLAGVRSAVRREPGGVDIRKNSDRFLIEIDCGDLQPGRKVWSEVFHVGKGASGDMDLGGLIYADNLPQPQMFTLEVCVNVAQTAMSVKELCSLPDNEDVDDTD